jgi:hypothetical protein
VIESLPDENEDYLPLTLHSPYPLLKQEEIQKERERMSDLIKMQQGLSLTKSPLLLCFPTAGFSFGLT